MATYAVDIDGTLCVEDRDWWKYAEAKPIKRNIAKINRLYREGHTIVLYTSRYEDDREVTAKWMKKHGVNYHRIEFGKFRADFYIDSVAKRPEEL
ncbi:MAG: hypothetical protein AM326_01670 [Candidatus Thorarchaeota archaeon SMTZ-45]|nr:MAG: hypothetical protein AM326_01670 [Candidatus Thorarchaeota archaeon SMTZ-45]